MELIDKVFDLCSKIVSNDLKHFSGIGILVYDSNEFDKSLHCDLRPDIKCKTYSVDDLKLIDYLKYISDYDNTLHDGFHMMDETGTLKYVAQYFVPPIVEGLLPDHEHGVRCYSSMCGSMLRGVLFVATICSDKSIYIFKKGQIYKFLEGKNV